VSTITTRHLLERDAELSRLYDAVGEARGGSGGLVLVEGPAGAGKSALLAAAAAVGYGEGLRVLRATGSEHEREFAFGAIRQLFEPVLAAADTAQRARLLAGAAGPAERIVQPPVADAELPDVGFVADHALYWLAANLTDDGPLLLAVDDLHWVDESSARAVGHLARRLADLPIALIVAMRPDEPGAPAALLDELRTLANATVVVPRPLTGDAVRSVVRDQLPEADDDACAAFLASSAGNPLYLAELLRTVDPAAPALGDAVRAASIPTLGDRVTRRLRRLDPAAVALATAMAVLGDGGALAIAATLAEIGEREASALARHLVRIEILAVEDPFAFVHPLIRRSVYDAMALVQCEELHAAAARLLNEAGAPTEAVAVHLATLRPAGSADAARTLHAAARTARQRAAPPEAIRWLLRALAEDAQSPPRGQLLLDLGQAEMAVRDPASVEHLGEAMRSDADVAVRTVAASLLVELLLAAGEQDAGIAVMTEAIRELGAQDPELIRELETSRASVSVYDPRLVAAFERDRERLERLAEADGWAAAALSVLLGAIVAVRCDTSRDAVALVERGLRNGRLLERSAGRWASAQALMALALMEQHDRTLQVAADVEAAGRSTGSLLGVITALGFRGFVQARRGELFEAEAGLRVILDVAQQSGMSQWFLSATFLLVDAVLEREALAEIFPLIEGLDVGEGLMESVAGAMLVDVRGRVRRVCGDSRGALADLRAGAEIFERLHVGPTFTPWRSELALALPASERDEADVLVAAELEHARPTGLARPTGVALRAQGILAGDDDAVDLLRESVAVLEGSDARLEHARSLVALGGLLRRRNLRSDARQPLVTGLELARRSGAQRLMARAEEELRAAGARPRRLAQTGPDALTASELRVARLAAQSRSNSEIAQELYVSRKTVETHLSHAYSKLGLSGQGARRGLAGALRDHA
jgi:DNA-binding CsgD family transcriptional regulator